MPFDFRSNANHHNNPTIELNLDEMGDVTSGDVGGVGGVSGSENDPGCTHFTWTLFNGGTCWMKKGRMSRHGTETITIKADDPNAFCAKLAKLAKRNISKFLLFFDHLFKFLWVLF